MNLVHRLCAALDDIDVEGIEACCTNDFRYVIFTHIPDIGKETIWFDQSLDGLVDLMQNLHRHVTMRGSFLRHVSHSYIDRSVSDREVVARSSVIVAYTPLDGASRLYAAGRYSDHIEYNDKDVAQIRLRTVQLQSRDLGPGPHLPI